jgi:hypothetical protein
MKLVELLGTKRTKELERNTRSKSLETNLKA